MTLAQLRTRLQALGYGSDPGSVDAQNELLNAAYDDVASVRRWPWLEVATDSTLTATIGSPWVDLSAITDLLFVDAVRLTFGTDYYDLEWKPIQEIREREQTDRDNGIPAYWTEVNGQLKFYPRPDRAYTLDVDYLKDPAELTADTDVPLFEPTYHDVLVWKAAVSMAYRERDLETAGFAAQQASAQLAVLMGAYGVRQRQTSRQVKQVPTKYGRFAG